MIHPASLIYSTQNAASHRRALRFAKPFGQNVASAIYAAPMSETDASEPRIEKPDQQGFEMLFFWGLVAAFLGLGLTLLPGAH